MEGLLFGTETFDGPNGTNTLTGATGGTSFLSNYELATINSGPITPSNTYNNTVIAPNTGFGEPHSSNWPESIVVIALSMTFIVTGYSRITYKRQKSINSK